MCEHWECPYKGCRYHQENTLFDEEDEPYFTPTTPKAMVTCTAYLDI